MLNSTRARLNRLLGEPCLFCLSPAVSRYGVCTDCLDELPWQAPGCARCAVNLNSNSAYTICGRCQQDLPPFDSCHCVFSYERPVDAEIQVFKQRGHPQAAHTFSQLLGRHYAAHYEDDVQHQPQLLLPVPMTDRDIRRRGFNQAALLARGIQQQSGTRILHNACQKLVTKQHQKELNANERLAQRGNLFTKNAYTKLTDGRHVAIIDDVITTTATVRDMARVLLEAGARHITVWALARTNQDLEHDSG